MNVTTAAQPTNRISTLLEEVRRRLVETGTRNRLINVNRDAKRSNSLNIINERADDVFAILRTNGKRMQFHATVTTTPNEDPDDARPAQGDVVLVAEEDATRSEERYTDQLLDAPLTADGLQKRLLRLAQDAKTAEEEQGINILFLAIGFLTWYEDRNSEVRREAPLILLPVQLVRNDKTSTYDIRAREDDVIANLPLQERLKADFGISLPEIDDSEDWIPSDYFDAVRGAIAAQPRWEIDDNGIQLGFFSFSKLLMLRDLDPCNWPTGVLSENELVAKLLEDGFAPEPSLFGPEDRLDEKLLPRDILHVVDADASQTKVIEEVRSGRNLVVQGPPGTGKSQTITNILAAAAHDGKTVLFMAEKMAALQVVHDRMCKVGLSDLCLELHSKNANKRMFTQELAVTINRGNAAPTATDDPEGLRATRDELNRISTLLHARLPDRDYSPYQAMSNIIGLYGRDVAPPQIEIAALNLLGNADRNRIEQDVRNFVAALEKTGPKSSHPFAGTRNHDLQPTDLQRLGQELDSALNAIGDLEADLATISDITGLVTARTLSEAQRHRDLLVGFGNAPSGISDAIATLWPLAKDRRLIEGLAAGDDWQRTRDSLATTFSDAAWDHDASTLRPHLAKGAGSFMARLFGKYRGASGELATILRTDLPNSPSERIALVDRLVDLQRKRKLLAEDEEYLRSKLGDAWRGERTSFSDLNACAAWLSDLANTSPDLDQSAITRTRAAIDDRALDCSRFDKNLESARNLINAPTARLDLALLDQEYTLDSLDLGALTSLFSDMKDGIDRYADWAHLAASEQRLSDAGLAPLLALVEEGKVLPEGIVDEYRYAVAEARWTHARACLPELNSLSQLDRHALVQAFQELEEKRISDVQALIRSKHLQQMPGGAAGEMGFLRGEIAKKRRHHSIRKVMRAAGGMVQRIKPVFLMSPISIAQYLPPGTVEFDLLVIDEASQVRPEDAFGAIARAKQIVVVGDQKQLPPTSFFDRLTDNTPDDEDDEDQVAKTAGAVEMESILTLCEARGLPQSMLEWHYRSRDPSLIAVSNREFYGDNLVLPPSPLQADDGFGLKFRRVPGVYTGRTNTGSGGRPGTNRIEAEEIVREIARHARETPDFSLGIVTFSKTQADMVNEVLELARRSDPVLDAFLREGKREDVFVKNIENVQGDERDVILISVGYGPQEADGRLLSMSFGPVNSEGGERRLNVLFSRSRIRCEIFASFDPGDIDLGRTSKDGPRVLKRFLEYAKSGILDQKIPTGEEADSDFEMDVANVVSSLGYQLDHQVGSAGFRIDIGVRNPDRPGQYIMAVECDGATYHSALWARERDRLRQDVLENLGWTFHRIWSTDWFRRRADEVQRLKTALDAAQREATSGLRLEGSNKHHATAPTDEEATTPRSEPVVLEPAVIRVPAYSAAACVPASSHEPHEIDAAHMARLVAGIVETEGPIHTDVVARRVAHGFGKTKVGSRMLSAVREGLIFARNGGAIRSDGEFWFTPAQLDAVPVRDRSDEQSPVTIAQYIPPMEIRAAAALVEQESGRMETDELARSIARLLGFKRAGPEFQKVIRETLEV